MTDSLICSDHCINARQLERQHEWSVRTFGPGPRIAGVIAHIRRELVEVENAPGDLSEWADVILLAFDGAMRSGGGEGHLVIDAVRDKAALNRRREWPDWRDQAADAPIEHTRPTEPPPVSDDRNDIAPGPAAILDRAADEWGALGVALAAAKRTDLAVLLSRLGAPPADPEPTGGTVADRLQAIAAATGSPAMAGWDSRDSGCWFADTTLTVGPANGHVSTEGASLAGAVDALEGEVRDRLTAAHREADDRARDLANALDQLGPE